MAKNLPRPRVSLAGVDVYARGLRGLMCTPRGEVVAGVGGPKAFGWDDRMRCPL